MPRLHQSSHHSHDWVVPAIATTALATTALAVGTFLYHNVPEYGWEGTWRLIWEGDAYSPMLRRMVDQLEQAEIDRSLQESRIHGMEAALDLARLNTVDGNDNNNSQVLQKWMEYCAVENSSTLGLERSLADVSDRLDKIAATIDSLVLSAGAQHDDTSSDLVQRIKQRKKLLSKSIVLDMERCDVLMGSYQVLKEQQ
jgi:hypothetical protein